MTLSFSKLVGAGNDFIFLNDSDFPDTAKRPALAQQICDRHFGVGADGLVFVASTRSNDFAWDFYNSDGSLAEMCGNAARCMVLYCQKKFAITPVCFDSLIGAIQGQANNNGFEVSWQLQNTQLEAIRLDDLGVEGFFVNTGVPHFVVVDPSEDMDQKLCLKIQQHQQFQPKQTNVTLLNTTGELEQQTKTFERGVRDFTLACGTGVIASALVLKNKKIQDKYFLKTPGGSQQVVIDENTVTLIGPAVWVFDGEYKLTGDLNV